MKINQNDLSRNIRVDTTASRRVFHYEKKASGNVPGKQLYYLHKAHLTELTTKGKNMKTNPLRILALQDNRIARNSYTY